MLEYLKKCYACGKRLNKILSRGRGVRVGSEAAPHTPAPQVTEQVAMSVISINLTGGVYHANEIV
jgi:hypothetical protein